MKFDLDFMRRAAVIAAKSKCWIGQGCVIAKDGEVLVEAWNETLPGEEFCREFRDRKVKSKKGLSLPQGKDSPLQNAGCIRHELGLSQGREIEKVCSVHAEANAIALAARRGIKIEGAAIYVTSFPCLICMRSIIASGIKKLVYMNDFYKPHHEEMLEKNGIKVEQMNEKDVWQATSHSVLACPPLGCTRRYVPLEGHTESI